MSKTMELWLLLEEHGINCHPFIALPTCDCDGCVPPPRCGTQFYRYMPLINETYSDEYK